MAILIAALCGVCWADSEPSKTTTSATATISDGRVRVGSSSDIVYVQGVALLATQLCFPSAPASEDNKRELKRQLQSDSPTKPATR